jgi:uncharacterized Zn-finger protein
MFSIFSSAFGVFLLYKLDSMIHGDLYNFGLQFSYGWALPTWTLERLIGVCLIFPMICGVIALIWDIRRSRNRELVVKHVESKPQLQPLPVQQREQRQQPQAPPASVNNNDVKTHALRENSMVISCPSCKKMFGKPLVMLDFSDKKTQLVNVCPYCNAVLGRATEKVPKEDVDVGVLNSDEEAEESRQ